MKKILWFVKSSLILDFKYLKVSQETVKRKLEFIAKKYFLILKHLFVNFEFGKNSINLGKKRIYYDSKYGLAGYQSIFARHQNLLRLANVEKADVVVDIGANAGYFSQLIKVIYPNANVYAFEPVPIVYKNLKLNLTPYKKVKVYNTAISDFIGKYKMNFNPQDSAISMLSEKGTVEVNVTTLDDFAKKNNFSFIDILKIDTETFEQAVLMGAKETLKRVKYLFIEITIENNSNYTFSSLISKLYSQDYDFNLVCFRNYLDVGEGKMPIMDALFVNTKLL